MYFFYRSFSDKIWPRGCISCVCRLETAEDFLCSTCLDHLEAAIAPRWENVTACASWYSWLDFDTPIVKNLMHQVKFGHVPDIARFLGALYAQRHCRPDVDAIVPIPLSKRRHFERGYNQSEWICKGLSDVWRLPILTKNLVKAHRPAQAKQNKSQRFLNQNGAFSLIQGLPAGIRIQLWDDTWTTGVTLNEAAWTIQAAQPITIHARSLTYAQ